MASGVNYTRECPGLILLPSIAIDSVAQQKLGKVAKLQLFFPALRRYKHRTFAGLND